MAQDETDGRTAATAGMKKPRKCRNCGERTTEGDTWGWAGFMCWTCEKAPGEEFLQRRSAAQMREA